MMLNFVFILVIPFICMQCKSLKTNTEYAYLVKETFEPHNINSEWDKEVWAGTRSISLKNFMGDRPSHFPETKVKLRYDKDNVYVIFSVRDRYVKAVAKETNGKVWLDSCVEFFFSPGPDTDRGYFNFEATCKGVFLFQYHVNNKETDGFVSMDDCRQVKISHSLTKDVTKEITEPLNWTLEYSIPFSVLSKYMKIEQPGPGVSWRANFYKCADNSSHPHWLTWTLVDYPRPKFHLPQFFGRLDFE